jgi:periplasmic protein TonB
MEAAGHAATGSGPDAAEALTAPRSSSALVPFSGSIALSTLLHGAALVLLARLAVAPMPPLVTTVIPVSLVSLPGGGGGPVGPVPGPPPGVPVAPPAGAAAPAAPSPPPAKIARATKPTAREVKPVARPAETSAVVTDGGSGSAGVSGVGSAGATGSGAGVGGGDGSGGDGSGGARIAYGQNPRPPYPRAARRLGMEGVVLLDVLVAPDGRAAEVRLLRSSGHPLLDDLAVRTVRERWRFIPARRDGAAVEGRVEVPIRFRREGEEEAG